MYTQLVTCYELLAADKGRSPEFHAVCKPESVVAFSLDMAQHRSVDVVGSPPAAGRFAAPDNLDVDHLSTHALGPRVTKEYGGAELKPIATTYSVLKCTGRHVSLAKERANDHLREASCTG